jgi:hypothetical protein
MSSQNEKMLGALVAGCTFRCVPNIAHRLGTASMPARTVRSTPLHSASTAAASMARKPLPSWRIVVIRKKAEYVGTVAAADAQAAIKEFG